jgi:SagB-type dehydrogenase family enzyme
LPVFDWHYLFGYATLLLVSLHLFFNLPTILRWLARRRAARAGQVDDAGAATGVGVAAGAPGARGAARRRIMLIAGAATALALAFTLGAHWAGRQAGPAPSPAALGPASDIATVLRYHEASSSSRSGLLRRAPEVDWGAQPAPFKSYPAARHLALPRAAPGGTGQRSLGAMLKGAANARRLDLAAVGQLLHLTAGVTARRGGLALRATPSSGALFPAELYLLARRVEGLPAGLYHFDPGQHRLARLGVLPPGAIATDADLLLVVAAVLQRTGYKYRDRAYRYVAADLGHLLENARLAGHYAGAHAELLDRFDEMALASTFGLDGVHEAVIAVAAFSGAPAALRTNAGAAPARPASVAATSGDATGGDAAGVPAATGTPATGTAATDAAATDGTATGGTSVAGTQAAGIGITGSVHAATSLAAPRLAVQDGAPHPDSLIVLPAGEPAQMDLARAILQRRSQRRFTTQPVPLRQLASILADMSQTPLLSNALHADLVVNRVDGLQPGVYRYLPARHALQPVQLGDFAAQARNAALDQDVIGDAAVVLVLSADAGLALKSGARGYRMAFLEAGLMGERWLLGAVARGLGACPVGAFYDDEAAALVKAPQGRWVLHFAALGHTGAN